MKAQGVSFRHAVELLKADTSLAAVPVSEPGAVKKSLVRRLPQPVALQASEQELLNQVIGYYHETLLQSPEAQAYLAKRGLAQDEAGRELIHKFRLGYANRTLGLRLPQGAREGWRRTAHAPAGAGHPARVGPRALQWQPGRAGVR